MQEDIYMKNQEQHYHREPVEVNHRQYNGEKRICTIYENVDQVKMNSKESTEKLGAVFEMFTREANRGIY
jgi:hypothetical protein